MPDGKEMLNELEFESRLQEFGDNQLELLKFVARQQFQTSKILPHHNKRITNLENRDRKAFGVSGGIGGIIGATIASVIDYLLRR